LKCEKCGKNNIVTTPPKASELKEAVSIVENAIDYIKIQQRESNPQEKEIVEKCADCLELMTAIAKMYENMEIHGNQKKKDRDRENRRTAFALTNRSILD
jgi:ribosomal protein L17